MTNDQEPKKRRPAKPKDVDARWSPLTAAEAIFNEANKASIQDQNHKRAIAIIAQALAEAANRRDVVETLQPTFDKVLNRLSDVARRLGNLEVLWTDKFGRPDAVGATSLVDPAGLPGDTIEIPVDVILREEGNLRQSSWEPSTISDGADKLSLGFDHTTDQLAPDRQPAALSRKYLGNPHPEKQGMSRKDMAQEHLNRVVLNLCKERDLPVTRKMIEDAANENNVDLDAFTKTYIKNFTENKMIKLGDYGFWPWGMAIPKDIRRRSMCWVPRQRRDREGSEQRIWDHNKFLESIGQPILVYRIRNPGKSHKDAYDWPGDKRKRPEQPQLDLSAGSETPKRNLPRPVLKPKSDE